MKTSNGDRLNFSKREIISFITLFVVVGIAWGGLTVVTKALARDNEKSKTEIAENNNKIAVIETKLENIQNVQQQIQTDQRHNAEKVEGKLDSISQSLNQLIGKMENKDVISLPIHIDHRDIP